MAAQNRDFDHGAGECISTGLVGELNRSLQHLIISEVLHVRAVLNGISADEVARRALSDGVFGTSKLDIATLRVAPNLV